ncbi:hypothetical protein WJX81_004897 [Elliptochloris bilobata]|uniref:Uncharacterized protein n=1 Tax=Elliptochloris bilobata TaxID=381761 RepID=A0AAW1RM37_9CHLO
MKLVLLTSLVVAATCTSRNPLHFKEGHDVTHVGSHEPHQIPHIFHQSWKDEDVPEKYAQWRASWIELHPGWEFKLWTDEDNEALVTEQYPWFKDTYDSFAKPVMKADASRVLYLHHYGGVYADLDFEALKNVEPLLADRHVLLAAVTKEDSSRHETQPIPNAWMASVRHHPFWLFALQTIIKAAGCVDTSELLFVESTTGPIMLNRALKAYDRVNGTGITVLDPGLIYPIDWEDTLFITNETPEENEHALCAPTSQHFDDNKCKSRFPDAYAITYWTHTWG